jgi:hypothetical protein
LINLTNGLQILTLFVMSTVLLVIWSLPTQAEGRTNALDARVTERLNKIDRRVQMLELKAGR